MEVRLSSPTAPAVAARIPLDGPLAPPVAVPAVRVPSPVATLPPREVPPPVPPAVPPPRVAREVRALASSGPAAPPPFRIGADGRAKRFEAGRDPRKVAASALHRAFVALTSGSETDCGGFARSVAALYSRHATCAYHAGVGDDGPRRPLPLPDLSAGDVRIPQGYTRAMASPHAAYWRDAVDKEWQGILANDTLEFVPRSSMPAGSNLMNSHYVFDCKPTASGSIEKFKSRLVADGNTQREGVDYEQIFATVVKMVSVRIALVIAARLDWGIWQLDVKQAFLQAEVDTDLYMRMPPNVPDRDAQGRQLVCKLKKSLYGLKQAAREWNEVLNATLLRFGFRRGRIDTCVYRYDASGGRTLILLVYVDDLVCLYSHSDVRDAFVAYISNALPIDDRGELQWVLRMEVERDRASRSLVLSQRQYAERLAQRFLPPGDVLRHFDSPLDEETFPLSREQCPAEGSEEHLAMRDRRATYMSAVGALLWLAAGTRPDLTYAVSQLAKYCSNPGEPHYAALMRTLGYVSRTAHYVLRFRPDPSAEVVVYSDASWLTKNSVSGGLIFFWGSPVNWWSRLQKSVAASTAEAEFFAAALATREAVYVRDFLEDLGYGVTRPTPLLLDSKSALDMAADPVAFKKTKHILRHAYELRDRVARCEFAPSFVDTTRQLADILTKGLRSGAHQALLPSLLHESVDGDGGRRAGAS